MRKTTLSKIAGFGLAAIMTSAIVFGNFSTTSKAASKSLGAPYNTINLSVLDNATGKNLASSSMKLRNSDGKAIASWSSANEAYANYPDHDFTMADASDTKTVPAGQFGLYSTVNPAFGNDSAVKFVFDGDKEQKIAIDNYYNNFGIVTPNASDFSFRLDGSGNVAHYYKVSATPTQYIKVRIRLNEYWPGYFDENGKSKGIGDNKVSYGVEERFGSDSSKSYLAIVSDQVINYVAPDANGYVDVYVNPETDHMDYETSFNYGSSSGGGRVGHPESTVSNEVSDPQDNNSTSGTLSVKNLPAGTYTVEASRYRSNETDSATFTVTESQNVQNFTVSLFTAPTPVVTEPETTTEAPTETPTETTTEEVTEAPTEETTEEVTEVSTEESSETGEVAADTDYVVETTTAVVESTGEVAADVDSVQTGDESNAKLYVIILVVAAVCLVAVGAYTIIRNKKDSDK